MLRVKKKSRLKYKGQKFIIVEAEMKSKLPGLRTKRYGVNRVLLNKDLGERTKQLELHRLLTGRGLRDIRTKRKVTFN